MTYVFKNLETPGNSMGFEKSDSDLSCVINHFNNLYVECVEQKLENLGLLINNCQKKRQRKTRKIRKSIDENKHRPIEYVVENIIELINLLDLSQTQINLSTALKHDVLDAKFMREFQTTRDKINNNTRTNYQINYNYESFDELADKLRLCRGELIVLADLISNKDSSLHDDFWDLPHISIYCIQMKMLT